MKRNVLKLIFAGVLSIAMFTGCSGLSEDTIIPSDIINNVLNSYENSKSYFSEATMKLYEKGELVEELTMKDWTDNSEGLIKKRIESKSSESGNMITTNNGKEVFIYMEKENRAMRMTVETPIDGNVGDYKEQFLKSLSAISKSHEIVYVDEEVVNDFKTIHLRAKSKKSNSLIGDMDYWIDKDTWFMVKATSENGDIKSEIIYTKLEFAEKFDDDLFTQIIPEGVEIENLDETLELEENNVSIEEAEKIVGKPILILGNNSEYELESITNLSYDSMKRTEISQIYQKNGVRAFILTVLINKEENNEEENLKLPGEEEAVIRGNKGTIIEDIVNLINWEEDGIKYSFLILDPSITMENAIEIVENLKFSK
jgi:outer membrane lipoprotein-sorting protein